MKLKNFQDLIQECLTKAEIAEVEQQAKSELKILHSEQGRLKPVAGTKR